MVVARAELCGATPFRTFDLGWLVGVDGGTRAELCGATPFRILDLGWRLGTMVVQSGALRSGLFRTFDIGWLAGLEVVDKSEALAERLPS